MEPIKASFFAHVQCTLEVLRGQQSYVTLDSGIDVEQGINVGLGKFGKKK